MSGWFGWGSGSNDDNDPALIFRSNSFSLGGFGTGGQVREVEVSDVMRSTCLKHLVTSILSSVVDGGKDAEGRSRRNHSGADVGVYCVSLKTQRKE